ncbi:MAG: cob(I)yrinic acid a,c-diamide adenosyltransferase [Deltaproteobacteria bacterium]|nr:MAG: cob(I)yrinic acid a,c-diamide adenosyltransferase [Deltaproteobacteria bacterium]
MKVYTKTGDKGITSLFSGERISKCHDRVETYGEIDELNSFVGMISAWLPQEEQSTVSEIQTIQKNLFQIGSWLATTPGSDSIRHLVPMETSTVEYLEKAIDRMEEALPRLQLFILPGGGPASAAAHVARTVCRRVERHVIRLIQNEKITEQKIENQMSIIQQYLNRLSDYFFVLARYCNKIANISDVVYIPKKKFISEI